MYFSLAGSKKCWVEKRLLDCLEKDSFSPCVCALCFRQVPLDVTPLLCADYSTNVLEM